MHLLHVHIPLGAVVLPSNEVAIRRKEYRGTFTIVSLLLASFALLSEIAHTFSCLMVAKNYQFARNLLRNLYYVYALHTEYKGSMHKPFLTSLTNLDQPILSLHYLVCVFKMELHAARLREEKQGKQTVDHVSIGDFEGKKKKKNPLFKLLVFLHKQEGKLIHV